jgi:hypothetical protein
MTRLLPLCRAVCPLVSFGAARPAAGAPAAPTAPRPRHRGRRDLDALAAAALLGACELLLACGYGCLAVLVCSAVLAPAP